MTRRLLALTTALTLTSALPGAAATVLSGTAGFEADTDNLELIVNDSLSGSSHAIKLNDGNDNSITNNGTIEGLGKDGINADGANLTVVNNGTITGDDDGVQAKDSDGLNVTNNGSISAGDEGITGADQVIIDNSGTITGIDDAVQIGENATITNRGTIENVGGAADPQDAIDLDSGTIVNEETGVILSTNGDAIDFDATNDPATPSTIENYGYISGQIGVLVEKGAEGAANTAAQHITNLGLIEGTSGLALDLGAGNDSLLLAAEGELIGGIDMGADDDLLEIQGLAYELVAGGSLLDGGDGTDTVLLGDYLFEDIFSAVMGPDDSLLLSLMFPGDTQALTMNLTNWELFQMGDDNVYTLDQVKAAVAPVPLPAGGLLLLAGLGALAGLRRRSVL